MNLGADSGSRLASFQNSAWLFPPLLAGLVLRFHGLLRQVLAGDEMHAVIAAMDSGFPEILYSYRLADHCIPLSALYRLWIEMGIPLSEIGLRIPVLLFGVAVLVLLPLIAERVLGRAVGSGLAWWLALSPLMVYYGRIVRSYMPVVLLGSLAVIAFYVWFRRPGFRAGAAYVVLGSLTVYFHLGTAPFVVAPFVFWGAAWILRRPDLPSFRSITLLGLSLSTGLGLFLIPGRESLGVLVGNKHAGSQISMQTLEGVLRLQSGALHPALAVLFWAIVALGLVWLLWKKPLQGLYGLTLVAVHALGLLILSPTAMNQANIFNRYLLVATPIIFVWASQGQALLVPKRLRNSLRGALLPALLPALFLLGGPLLTPGLLPGSFAHSAEFMLYFRSTRSFDPDNLPAAYAWLEERSADGAIAEFPWQFMWRYSQAYPKYQVLHGREVLVVPVHPQLQDSVLEFRNMVPPDPDRLLASRASFFLVHLDPLAEERSVRPDSQARGSGKSADWERRARRLTRMARLARDTVARLEENWGRPDFADESLLVWDLDRLREEGP